MSMQRHNPTWFCGRMGIVLLTALASTAAFAQTGVPNPTPHTQRAYHPEASFTSRWSAPMHARSKACPILTCQPGRIRCPPG